MKRKSICILIVICLSLLCLAGCGKDCNAIVKDYSKKMEKAVNSSVSSMKSSGSSIGVAAAYSSGADEVSDYVDEANGFFGSFQKQREESD